MPHEWYSIIQSHMYDIYSILSGTIVFVLLYFVKPYIKAMNARAVYGDEVKVYTKEEQKRLRRCYQRRNAILFPVIFIMGMFVYAVCAMMTNQIEFRWGPALMSGPIAIAEYAVLKQLL